MESIDSVNEGSAGIAEADNLGAEGRKKRGYKKRGRKKGVSLDGVVYLLRFWDGKLRVASNLRAVCKITGVSEASLRVGMSKTNGVYRNKRFWAWQVKLED